MIFFGDIIRSILELGCIYSLLVAAVTMSSRIIAFDDLSTEGSFAAGGALAAVIALQGVSCVWAVAIAVVAGAIIGMVTGLLHTQLKINNLMSGIVVTTGLFSLNLKLAGSSITLAGDTTFLDCLSSVILQPWSHLIVLSCISGIVVVAFCWFLSTEVGFLLRATGSNPQILATLGKRVAWYKIMGLAIANGITGLAGALFVIHVGFFSISGSIGILAVALAGLIIGNVVCGNRMIGVVVGAVVYQAVIALTIEMQCDPAWNKLITALLIVVLVAVRKQQPLFDTGR